MIHELKDEWAIEGVGEGIIDTRLLWDLVKYKQLILQHLSIDKISHKPLDTIDIRGPRYKLADTRFPLLVVEGMANPHNKPYRLIDGRHRLLKHIEGNLLQVPCYILLVDQVLPHVRPL